jgi:riboflavin synthase
MFTGIVEEVGTVVALDGEGDVVAARIAGGPVVASLGKGGSIAVNGCCLTAVSVRRREFLCHLTAETLSRTAFGSLRPGAAVNLERPLRADGRFDGHIVQGHVDGVGTISALDRHGRSADLVVEPPPRLLRYIVEKGSIAVDGVSLTVAAVRARAFTVALIPYTLERTSFRDARPGRRVNLEADVVAKYVERLRSFPPPGRAPARRPRMTRSR